MLSSFEKLQSTPVWLSQHTQTPKSSYQYSPQSYLHHMHHTGHSSEEYIDHFQAMYHTLFIGSIKGTYSIQHIRHCIHIVQFPEFHHHKLHYSYLHLTSVSLSYKYSLPRDRIHRSSLQIVHWHNLHIAAHYQNRHRICMFHSHTIHPSNFHDYCNYHMLHNSAHNILSCTLCSSNSSWIQHRTDMIHLRSDHRHTFHGGSFCTDCNLFHRTLQDTPDSSEQDHGLPYNSNKHCPGNKTEFPAEFHSSPIPALLPSTPSCNTCICYNTWGDSGWLLRSLAAHRHSQTAPPSNRSFHYLGNDWSLHKEHYFTQHQ